MTMRETKETKTINVDLPVEIHRQLRIACAAKDLTFSQAVAQAVRDWAKRVVT
jgi:hypothetical protein